MKYVIYDTETTGLTGNDEVVEFGAIVTDENLNAKKAYKFYSFTQVPFSEQAQKITGLTPTIVRDLSNGKVFEDNWCRLPFVGDKDIVWVSYSTNGFDERLINQTLYNNGLPKYDFGKRRKTIVRGSGGYVFDVYAAIKYKVNNGKDKKLEQVLNGIGIPESNLNKIYHSVGIDDCTFHDALYDACSLYIILYSYRERLGICSTQI